MTMTLISTVTVPVTSGAINFASVPQTPFTDLLVLLSPRSAAIATTDPLLVRINQNTSNIYSRRSLIGNGSAASSANETISFFNCGEIPAQTATASTFANVQIYIPNYAGASNKSVSVDLVGEQNGTTAFQVLLAGLFSTTSPITEINLFPANGSFLQYSTASLYGITKGSGGATVS